MAYEMSTKPPTTLGSVSGHTGNSGVNLGTSNSIHDEEHDRDDEDESLLQEHQVKEHPEAAQESSGANKQAIIWMVINVVATILLVFTNKAIFEDQNLKFIQISFAAYHFAVTWLGLWILSHRFAIFEPKHVPFLKIIPLSVTMALNVIFPNLSLAFSTVAFYQIARVLLTPCVAVLDYMLYRVTVPLYAILALVPACIGVGMVSYYDSRPSEDAKVKTTSELGVIFALVGVFFSSLYTVWISAFRRRLNMSSMQLLLNQAPVSAFLLLYFIPCIDTFPVWAEVPINRWVLIFLSGALAVLINVSQFFIIAQTGPVTSTIVGHSKTCIIVILGLASSGRTVDDMCVIGLLMALVGIIGYSIVMIKEKEKAAKQMQHGAGLK